MLLPHIRGKFSTHGHVPLDIIWQSIVGLTEHFQNGRIEEAVYDQYCSFLKMELGDHLTNAAERVRYSVYDTSISNLAASTENNSNNNANGTGTNGNVPTTTVVQISGQQNGNIEESSEYRFYLYRHWSLYEAMKHSSYIASRFPVWKAEGREKFQELFAKMGVPLPQCEQLFPFMKPEFRSHFQRQICNPDIIKKYKFVNPGITFRVRPAPSFSSFFSFH
jgi:cell division control protein 45